MAITGGAFHLGSALNRVDGVTSNYPPDDIEFFRYTETITLSTVAATTDTTAGFLPANSVIFGVFATVTTALTGAGATGIQVGDGTTAARWGTTSAVTLGATNVGAWWNACWTTGIASTTTGNAVGGTALAARITVTGGGNPTAGAVRLTVFGWRFVGGSV